MNINIPNKMSFRHNKIIKTCERTRFVVCSECVYQDLKVSKKVIKKHFS